MSPMKSRILPIKGAAYRYAVLWFNQAFNGERQTRQRGDANSSKFKRCMTGVKTSWLYAQLCFCYLAHVKKGTTNLWYEYINFLNAAEL